MQAISGNNSFDLCKMDSSENYHSPTETEDDVYLNTQYWRPKPKKYTDIFVLRELKKVKFCISALGLLLLLGALMALCAVGILYHNKVVSFEILHEQSENATVTLMMQENKAKDKDVSFEILREQYENATATLMMQENKAKEKEGMYDALEVKYQELNVSYNKKEGMYEALEEKYQELNVSYNKKEGMYEALEAKYRELNVSCSNKEGMYEALKEKYQKLNLSCSINQGSRCEEGWKSLGLKCYYFSTEKLNWMQSRDYCVGKGGHLVIITSQTEQNFASSQIGETHWIGLNDLETEGKWMWVNNQPLKETDVKFWFSNPGGSSEPDNWKKEDPSGEDCAALGHEIGNINKWFDASCLKRKRFICEK
ncbi:asialoglycoprotein receptor 2 isoform X1 [Ictalurus furcatus]|uniref:asialoglycoprotein receptor 2 isoform X1 n=1 Tax=Ictalurus furcatus TaxID=66913 RepID=UPI002350A151|nr:asialoglycoprotein receptor 2 isoform X1 [Ictalurus furcatus]